MSLSDRLTPASKKVIEKPKRDGPLWKGPETDGITFSMLSRFLVCRERFRLSVIEGLRPQEGFNHRIEYGQMWHVCEEALAENQDTVASVLPVWEPRLTAYAKELVKQYPTSAEQIDHWYQVCKVQFPLYVEYWAKHPDVKNRTPIVQEQVFNVPYDLPSGRTVRLRGKFDSVDQIVFGKVPIIYLQENKTKGDIRPEQLQRQLTFDLQTMMYLTALSWDTGIEEIENVKGWDGKKFRVPVAGVRYNVVRRPLSGGKGTIVQHKPSKSNPQGETKAQYYSRLKTIIEESPGEFFMRWNVGITKNDIDRFRRQTLDPLLEQLCDWYGHVTTGDPFRSDFDGNLGYPVPGGLHWRHPFGVYNVMDEGGSSDLDEYLATGSEVGLTRVDKLFSELEETQ